MHLARPRIEPKARFIPKIESISLGFVHTSRSQMLCLPLIAAKHGEGEGGPHSLIHEAWYRNDRRQGGAPSAGSSTSSALPGLKLPHPTPDAIIATSQCPCPSCAVRAKLATRHWSLATVLWS